MRPSNAVLVHEAALRLTKVCRIAGCGREPFGMHLGVEYCRRHLREVRKPHCLSKSVESSNSDETKLDDLKFGDGWVYFVKMDGPEILIKIGCSREPEFRIDKMQTGCPYPLTILAVWRSKSVRLLERKLHKKFMDHRFRAEWFRPSDEMLTLIELLLDGDFDKAQQCVTKIG